MEKFGFICQQFKRKVVEKKVGPNFIRVRDGNRIHLTTLIRNYQNVEQSLKKKRPHVANETSTIRLLCSNFRLCQ